MCAQAHISECFRQLAPPPSDISREGAIPELLAKSGFYTHDRPDVLPYSKDKVSWPSPGSSRAPLLDGLEGSDYNALCDWETNMLIDNTNNDFAPPIPPKPIQPHCDKKLFSSPHVYGDFLLRLYRVGMLCFRKASGPRDGVLGVFFVAKKDGNQRIIFDTRLLNQSFRDPQKLRYQVLPVSPISKFDSTTPCT